MYLSIIFPAYDEEKKIKDDVLRASSFLISEKIDGEIIVVDDGSNDKTFEIASDLKSKIKTDLKVIKHVTNLGKGAAIKEGILTSRGKYVLYSDVGNIVPFKYSLAGIKLLDKIQADVANGSRKLPNSIIAKEQNIDRIIASNIFNWMIHKYLKIPNYFTDTQCGFKIYKNEVAKNLFAQLQTNGFLFELEIILRGLKNKLKIIEFPVEWRCDRDSRISFIKTTPKVLKEILAIKKMFN